MNVLVTGGTGYIGAHLVKILVTRGYTVHALVRSMEKARNIARKDVILFQGNLLNRRDIERAMLGCGQAYHLSAYARVWARRSKTYYEQNVQATVNVLQAAISSGVTRVVLTSTAGILGPSIEEIVTEKKVRDIDFFNEYEGSKCLAESKAKDFIIQDGLDVVIVAPTRVYGPQLFGEPVSVNLMIEKYIHGGWRVYPGGGTQIGNYAYVEDVALGHILAMENGRKGHTYLLGGENKDYITFFEVLSEVSGVRKRMIKVPIWTQILFGWYSQFVAGVSGIEPLMTPKWITRGRFDWKVSSQKAVDELGLPVTPLEEGIARTIDWLRSKKKKLNV